MKKFFIYTLFFLFINHLSLYAQADRTSKLKVGDTIPNVELTTMENLPFMLSADQKGQPLVLIFYRANWCPFCNTYLADLQSYFKPLMKQGYKLIAISTESVVNLKKTKDNNFLRYTLLSDPLRGAIGAFGIINSTNTSVAVPSVFITDKDHVIRYLYTNTDYKVRLSGEEILNKAIELKGK